jgi:hypothetical protein
MRNIVTETPSFLFLIQPTSVLGRGEQGERAETRLRVERARAEREGEWEELPLAYELCPPSLLVAYRRRHARFLMGLLFLRTYARDCDIYKKVPYNAYLGRGRGFPPLSSGLHHLLSVTELLSMDLTEQRHHADRARPIARMAQSVDRDKLREG